MKKILFSALMTASLAACSNLGTNTPVDTGRPLAELVGTQWQVPSLAVDGKAPDGKPIVPWIKFNTAKEIVGHTGCNPFQGPAILGKGSLYMGPVATTRRYCSGPEMGSEAELLRAMAKVRRGHWEGSKLELRDAGGAPVLTLQRAE